MIYIVWHVFKKETKAQMRIVIWAKLSKELAYRFELFGRGD